MIKKILIQYGALIQNTVFQELNQRERNLQKMAARKNNTQRNYCSTGDILSFIFEAFSIYPQCILCII